MKEVAILLVIACCMLSVQASSQINEWHNTTFTAKGQYYSFHPNGSPLNAIRDGLNFTAFSNSSSCSFTVCWHYLTSAVENFQVDTKQNCFAVTEVTNKVVSQLEYITSGWWHFLVQSNSDGVCGFFSQLIGDQCDTDRFGSTCSTLAVAPTSGSFSVPANSSKVYAFWASPWQHGQSTSGLSVVFTQQSAGKAGNTILYIREGDYPRPELNVYDQKQMVNSNGTMVGLINNPRITWNSTAGGGSFLYFFMFVNPDNDTVSYNWNQAESTCPAMAAGPKCLDAIIPVSVNMSYEYFLATGWHYLAPIVLPTANVANLEIGFTILDTQKPPPVYLKLGNIPTADDYDVVLNNPSASVRYYNTQKTFLGIAEWYIGINVQSLDQVGTVGVWFQSACPSQCSFHGNCVNNACQCDENFSVDKFDCSIEGKATQQSNSQSGMPGGEVALIVILCLICVALFASCAVNGFLAYKSFAPARSSSGGKYDILQGL